MARNSSPLRIGHMATTIVKRYNVTIGLEALPNRAFQSLVERSLLVLRFVLIESPSLLTQAIFAVLVADT